MKIKIRDSDLDILEVASNQSRVTILNNLVATIEEIVSTYDRYIMHESVGNTGRYLSHYRPSRVYKIADRRKGLQLFYTLSYEDRERTELRAWIATKRSKWYSKESLSDKDIYDAFATEEIERMLINRS